jgi:hypothetical protein
MTIIVAVVSLMIGAALGAVTMAILAMGNDEENSLIAAAPEMLAALLNVRKLISEAAMTGFNWQDGDWAERLFVSQQVTSAAIAKATTPRGV